MVVCLQPSMTAWHLPTWLCLICASLVLSVDTFTELLDIRDLPDGKILTRFNFSIQTDSTLYELDSQLNVQCMRRRTCNASAGLIA